MKIERISSITFIVLLATFSSLASVRAASMPEAKRVERTKAAWDALVQADYAGAIANAELVIRDFKQEAKLAQDSLEKSGKVLLKGVVSAEARQEIQANGPLNDVATCYFIIGEAHRRFVYDDPAKLQAARIAYGEARKLHYGRFISTNGIVSVPAETAELRIQSFESITNAPTAKSTAP